MTARMTSRYSQPKRLHQRNHHPKSKCTSSLQWLTTSRKANLGPRKKESPVGEVTTTSDYFASSGKSKPTRSTPTKPRAAVATSAKSTPRAKATPKPEPATSGKTSSRKKNKPNYVELDDDEEDDFAFLGQGTLTNDWPSSKSLGQASLSGECLDGSNRVWKSAPQGDTARKLSLHVRHTSGGCFQL